jgi:hypothetical protein
MELKQKQNLDSVTRASAADTLELIYKWDEVNRGKKTSTYPDSMSEAKPLKRNVLR